MGFFYKDANGEVFAYETKSERDQYGAPDLIVMTPEEVAEHLTPVPSTPTVPFKVTMRQARLALLQAGLLGQVESAIDALPEPRRTEARIEWDYASEVHKGSEFVGMMGAALMLDGGALDELFVTAAGL